VAHGRDIDNFLSIGISQAPSAATTRTGLGCHYDRALLIMQTAICYCEAGQPERAAALSREHLDDDQISHRDRGYFLSLMRQPAWPTEMLTEYFATPPQDL